MWRLCFKGFAKDTNEEKKPPPIWCPLSCTLEELYSGVQKRIKFTGGRLTILHGPGEISSVIDPEIFAVNIAPGSNDGDKIVFQSLFLTPNGGKIPGDVIFTIVQEPHDVFERRGDDLWLMKKIPLMEYLTKQTLTIETLDKRSLSILKTQPCCVTQIINEGMPNWYHGMKGSLFISFEVVFPKNLNLKREEREELKKLLSDAEEDN